MASESVFLLYCENKSDFAQVKKVLAANKGALTETAHSESEVSERVARETPPVKCVFYSCAKFDTGSLKTVDNLRHHKPTLPVVVISDSVAKEVYAYSRRLKSVIIQERPLKDEAIQDICAKVLEGKEVYRRQHERIPTHEKVTIERLNEVAQFKGIMHNASIGGCYLEVGGAIEVGDVLKVIVAVAREKKEHTVYAQVVRVEADRHGPGKVGIGCRYISPEDLYTALLESAEATKNGM